MLKMPKKLTLDYKTWICGVPEMNSIHSCCHGEGNTYLLNSDGFSCCLGQFMKQAEVNNNELSGTCNPDTVDSTVQDLVNAHGKNSYLTQQAMSINDNKGTEVQDKAIQLQDLFADHGYDIELINFPEV